MHITPRSGCPFTLEWGLFQEGELAYVGDTGIPIVKCNV